MRQITSNSDIDFILESHERVLGKDYQRYRNHVYRVVNFALPHIRSKDDLKKISIAAAFHDIGIWTDHTFNYLGPSTALAKDFCSQNHLGHLTSEIAFMIDNHHKLTTIKSSDLAEVFRLADLEDLTFGLISKRNGKQHKSVRTIFPYLGFHRLLIKLFIKNLIANPLHPFPIFKI